MNQYYRTSVPVEEVLFYAEKIAMGYMTDTGYNPVAGELSAIAIFYNGFLFDEYKEESVKVCQNTKDVDVVLNSALIMNAFKNAVEDTTINSFGFAYKSALAMVEQRKTENASIVNQLKNMLEAFKDSITPLLNDEKIMGVISKLGNMDAIEAQQFGDAVYSAYANGEMSKKDRRAKKK